VVVGLEHVYVWQGFVCKNPGGKWSPIRELVALVGAGTQNTFVAEVRTASHQRFSALSIV